MKRIANILIVDDDVDVVNLFEQFLKLEGHNILSKAFDGEEAIDIFQNFEDEIDIVIMDHRMPLMNGLDATREILKINSKSKIIFVSADYTIRDQALEAGAIDFLEKPIDFNTLNIIIEKYSLIKNETN